jgi:hypothetical protein
MRNRLLDNERIKRASLYITAAVLCVLILCVFFKIWRADLRVPFYYSGDSLFYSMFVRGTIDNGWYWRNPALGAPDGQVLYDFPGLDNAVAIGIRLLSVFTHNTWLVLNLFYLLTFPLITLASLYAFRQFKFSYLPALVCSLLYAFLPYHFMRNETHFLLSAYYAVPLAVMVLLWVAAGALELRTKKFIVAVIACVIAGSSGIYYPFFSCYLLLIAGAIGSLKLRRLQPLGMALIMIALTCATIVINLSPSFIDKYRHPRSEVLLRSPAEAERYGLRISQLVLPISDHRIARFDRIKRLHNSSTTITENDTSSLGLIGSIGFLALLVQLLLRKELLPDPISLFRDLSMLNIFAVLLGIIGGFGFLFAVLVSSAIRSYNRISTYIAFFSLMAVALGLESLYRRMSKQRIVFYVLVGTIFIGGFLDQTAHYFVPDYSRTRDDFVNDAEFVNRIEASVPAGAMIFQLPYVPFPENGPTHQMKDYDHFRGYLHSKNLRWSYGTMKGGPGDRAQQRVAQLPPAEFVEALVSVGFSGIYLDRNGYEDGGAAMESELSKILQSNPVVSTNGRLLFFNLTDYGRSLREKISDSEWQAKRDSSFYPLLLDWTGGFSGLETSPGKTWRWCSNEGELRLNNTSKRPRTISLEMSFATGNQEINDFFISGLISEQMKVGSALVPYSKTVVVPPGEWVIKFRSTAKRVDAPLDPRFLVFRIENFKMTELQ